METIKKLVCVAVILLAASCDKNYNVLGTWESTTITKAKSGKEYHSIIVETFKENGEWEKRTSQMGLINDIETGTYTVVGDSIFLQRTKLVVNGREWPNESGSNIHRKIVKADDEHLIYIQYDDTTKLNKATTKEK